MLQVQVLLTVLIAAGVLRERPSGSQLGGVALGSLGLLAVALGRGGKISILALALTVWSALAVPLPLLGLSLFLDGPSVVGAALADAS